MFACAGPVAFPNMMITAGSTSEQALLDQINNSRRSDVIDLPLFDCRVQTSKIEKKRLIGEFEFFWIANRIQPEYS